MKVLVSALGKLGDTVLTTPFYRVLKQEFNFKRIDVIVSEGTEAILIKNPFVDNIFIYKKKPWKALKFINKVRKTKYEYFIDPKDHYSKQSLYIAKLIRAKFKIGFNNKDSQYFDYSVNPGKLENKLHHILIFLNSLDYFGWKLPNQIPRPELYPKEIANKEVSNFIKSNSLYGYYCLNISASKESKMIDKEKISEFLSEINTNSPIVLINGPSDKEYINFLLNQHKNLIRFESRSYDHAIGIIKNSNLLITPDTSLVHIASAYNIPILAFYSELDNFYNKFHPLSDLQVIIRPNTPNQTIKDIPVESMVCGFKKIERLMSNY